LRIRKKSRKAKGQSVNVYAMKRLRVPSEKQQYPDDMREPLFRDQHEPLLRKNKNRFVMFPLQDQEIWNMYKKHVASFWSAEEIDLVEDVKDWKKLSSNERHFLKHILAFFAASDGIVLENLLVNFGLEVQLPEARYFYAFQAAMENIHSETYSLLIDTFVKDGDEKTKLFQAMYKFPCVAKKAQWAIDWMEGESLSFAQRLVAFAAVEGIFFSGSFCAIFWLKKRGIMPGLTFSNELISRDEGLHTDFACMLYHKLRKPLSGEMVRMIIESAVECEKEFILEALPVSLIGMNNLRMAEYIEFVADRLVSVLGCPKIYHTANPFEWMEMISLQGKTNFFDKRVGEYAKANMTGSKEENGFSLDCDF